MFSLFLVQGVLFSQLLCYVVTGIESPVFVLNGLFTDKLKVSSVPEQPKEEKEIVKPSVPVAEPESSSNTAGEKHVNKTEPARIQPKDKKRWVTLFSVSASVNPLVDGLCGAGWSHTAGSIPLSSY